MPHDFLDHGARLHFRDDLNGTQQRAGNTSHEVEADQREAPGASHSARIWVLQSAL